MNEWKQALKGLLGEEKTPRQPVLRRSRRPDWLYTTDLPGLISEEALQSFRIRAEAAGWWTEVQAGWLEFTRKVSSPPAGWFEGARPEEAGCCASLLRRHSGLPAENRDRNRQATPRIQADQRDGNREAIALMKAGEEGTRAYEKLCAALHRDWAARLRRGERLPALDPAFFENTEECEQDGESGRKEQNEHAV